jgi:hypothetical protein
MLLRRPVSHKWYPSLLCFLNKMNAFVISRNASFSDSLVAIGMSLFCKPHMVLWMGLSTKYGLLRKNVHLCLLPKYLSMTEHKPHENRCSQVTSLRIILLETRK